MLNNTFPLWHFWESTWSAVFNTLIECLIGWNKELKGEQAIPMPPNTKGLFKDEDQLQRWLWKAEGRKIRRGISHCIHVALKYRVDMSKPDSLDVDGEEGSGCAMPFIHIEIDQNPIAALKRFENHIHAASWGKESSPGCLRGTSHLSSQNGIFKHRQEKIPWAVLWMEA